MEFIVEDSAVDRTAHSIQGKIDMTECHCWGAWGGWVTRDHWSQDHQTPGLITESITGGS